MTVNYGKPIIVVDSCADMPQEFYQENDIRLVSLCYNIDGGDTLQDTGTPHETKLLYGELRKGKTSVTTQVNVFAFKELFQELLKESRPILYLAFSSGLSGTFNSGRIAAEELKEEYPDSDITVVDSLAASMGEGLLLYYVVEMIKQKKTVPEIVTWLEQNRLRLNHWFTVDDLNHLKRGGRISATSAAVGTMLSIKPVLWMDKAGTLKPVSKERGRKKAILALYDKMIELGEDLENQMIFISHGDCYEEALILRDKIQENIKVKGIWLNYVGPVIGTHSGPGTIALFFLGKERAN